MSSHSTPYTAVQAVAPGRLELSQKPLVEARSEQVRVRVQACGVRHSDAGTVEGVEGGRRREVPVCDVHRCLALASAGT